MRISIDEAKQLLLAGKVVAIPTETVYGLAALLFEEEAVKKIFTLKGRPSHNPLILHIAKKEQCAAFCQKLPGGFGELAEAFWPGPLTLVLPIKEELVPAIARAGLPTAAFRVPNHPITLELLERVSPLVAPSANISGSPSSTKPEHVENDFGKNFPVVDGGPSLHGVESTILVEEKGLWKIARLGAISQDGLERVLGYRPEFCLKPNSTILCPGQLLQHYAPLARLILSEESFGHTVVGYEDERYLGATKHYCLGKKSDPESVSFRLYDTLRQLDLDGVKEAWVDMAIPSQGLWQTIRERLTRAASR